MTKTKLIRAYRTLTAGETACIMTILIQRTYTARLSSLFPPDAVPEQAGLVRTRLAEDEDALCLFEERKTRSRMKTVPAFL